MATVSIEEAQVKLSELINELAPGKEVVITRDSHPVAKLVGPSVGNVQPVFGRGKGKLVILADDDEHLKDFQDYMP
jgi:prevent-host-death family protein